MRSGTSGFTFIEVLAALLFLAILVPVIVGALTLSNRASVLSERKLIAAELAENKLNEQLINANGGAISATGGDFAQDYPGYRWGLTQASWQGDTANPMTELTMEVFFPVQGKEHSVRFTTLLAANGQSSSQTQSGTSQSK